MVASVEGAMWTGDNLWHRTVICHNSNCMELELAPKGKDMSSLLVFSTLEAINLSLNIQKDHFFFQKSIPWGLYCLRKVIYTSAVRLRASKLHCPLLLRSEVGKRGSQRDHQQHGMVALHLPTGCQLFIVLVHKHTQQRQTNAW